MADAPEAATRSVDRALTLLSIICDRGAMGLVDVSTVAGLAPSTATRLLRTLVSNGFLRRDEGGTYSPGSRMIQLGAQALSRDALVPLCRAAMEDLVKSTGESVYLSLRAGADTALYVAIVEGTKSVRHANWVGRVFSLENSAAGHVLLGRAPASGFEVVERGVEADVTAVAAPLYSDRSVVGAISIVVPSYRVEPGDMQRFGAMLAAETAGLSAALSHSSVPRRSH